MEVSVDDSNKTNKKDKKIKSKRKTFESTEEEKNKEDLEQEKDKGMRTHSMKVTNFLKNIYLLTKMHLMLK